MLKGDAIIAISKFIKQHIQDEYGMTKNIHVILEELTQTFFLPNKLVQQD